jgi:hypothetical protein
MEKMDIKEIIKSEQKFLRAELQQLKKCQLQYFIISVTGTSIIFSLLNGPAQGKELFFLAPLLIILPCWWTFFDKATTITRLVGYTVWLESQLSSQDPVYIGYETALQMFRQREDVADRASRRGKSLQRAADGSLQNNSLSVEPNSLPQQQPVPSRLWKRLVSGFQWIEGNNFIRLLTLRTRNRFWMINWYTFFALTSVCCLLPLHFGLTLRQFSLDTSPWYLAIAFEILSVIYTLRIIIHLTHGRYSYEKVTEFWKEKVFKDNLDSPQLDKTEPCAA